jgi:hypothetical protein
MDLLGSRRGLCGGEVVGKRLRAQRWVVLKYVKFSRWIISSRSILF